MPTNAITAQETTQNRRFMRGAAAHFTWGQNILFCHTRQPRGTPVPKRAVDSQALDLYWKPVCPERREPCTLLCRSSCLKRPSTLSGATSRSISQQLGTGHYRCSVLACASGGRLPPGHGGLPADHWPAVAMVASLLFCTQARHTGVSACAQTAHPSCSPCTL